MAQFSFFAVHMNVILFAVLVKLIQNALARRHSLDERLTWYILGRTATVAVPDHAINSRLRRAVGDIRPADNHLTNPRVAEGTVVAVVRVTNWTLLGEQIQYYPYLAELAAQYMRNFSSPPVDKAGLDWLNSKAIYNLPDIFHGYSLAMINRRMKIYLDHVIALAEASANIDELTRQTRDTRALSAAARRIIVVRYGLMRLRFSDWLVIFFLAVGFLLCTLLPSLVGSVQEGSMVLKDVRSMGTSLLTTSPVASPRSVRVRLFAVYLSVKSAILLVMLLSLLALVIACGCLRSVRHPIMNWVQECAFFVVHPSLLTAGMLRFCVTLLALCAGVCLLWWLCISLMTTLSRLTTIAPEKTIYDVLKHSGEAHSLRPLTDYISSQARGLLQLKPRDVLMHATMRASALWDRFLAPWRR